MKIFVIGGSGLVGSHVLRAAALAGHPTVGTYRKFPLPGLVAFDCAVEQTATTLIDKNKPDAVIYAAGWTWVDGCEDDPDRAFEENARQPQCLARLCHTRGIRFVYFSTSYVFDGTRGPYTEEDTPNPINVYSRSKWEGEQRVQDATEGMALIPRVVTVYGAEAQHKNFAWQVWRALEEGWTIRVPSDQISNPTYAADIARWLVALLEQASRGIWNLASPFLDWTRPRWAKALVSAFETAGIRRHPAFSIEEVPTIALGQKALRPLNAGMTTSKLAKLNLPATEFVKSVEEMVRQDREWYLRRS
jgi:dTDP-4-dehydrorhamnose reductase